MKSPRIVDKITSVEESQKVLKALTEKPEVSTFQTVASVLAFVIIYGVGLAFLLYLLWLIWEQV